MTIEERIKDVQTRKYANFFINGMVFCKGCGQIIKQASPMAHYIQITITCDDGSAHVTHCCMECCRNLTLEDLNDFILIDGLQMIKEAKEQNQALSDGFINLVFNRKATGVTIDAR